MAKGLLRIEGVIDVNQFWPNGTSDADTVKIVVDPANSFSYQSTSGTITKTPAFIGAWVNCRKATKSGQQSPAYVISKQNTITVRLQGIDAPELHYPTTVSKKKGAKKKNGDFRQMHGARAAQALGAYIASFAHGGTTKVHCHFESIIDKPTQACDSHGRFVGDIFVGLSAGGQSINRWLVQNGWAYPLFYDSMQVPETDVLVKAWQQGKNIAGRPGKAWRANLLAFGEQNRIERPYKIPGFPGSDKGLDNYPKIFRRQSSSWIKTAGALTPAHFYDLLAKSTQQEHDYLMTYKTFEKLKGKKPKKWQKLIDYVGKNGKTLFQPISLVFKEEPSALKTGPCSNPKPVTGWS